MPILTKNILRLEGLVGLVFSLIAYNWLGYSWWWFALFLLVPDVFMIGYLKNNKLGALTYNIGHTYVSPAVLALLAYLLHWDFGIALAAIWIAHVGMDRAMGYGLKSEKGFQHTHLGKIGRK